MLCPSGQNVLIINLKKLNRMRKLVTVLCAVFLNAAWAWGQTYHSGDIAVINSIIDNNGLNWTKAAPEDGSYIPADWLPDEAKGTGVHWSDDADNKRIILLSIGGESLTGILDVSGLDNMQGFSCLTNSLTALNVSNLVNLRELYCGENSLTSLDVSTLTDLQTLDCSENSLTALDVSGLSNLRELYCGNNSLTALDISGLTDLQEFYCYNNSLTTLDVTELTKLEDLDCDNNSLTALAVTGLTELKFLSCAYNNLTALDITELTKLKLFSCYHNNLTSLDVSRLTDLRSFLCWNNHLTSLDLTGLNNLTYFYGNYQQVSLTMQGSAGNYTGNVAFGSGTAFDNVALSYSGGVLTSTSDDVLFSSFTSPTGPGYNLTGTVKLSYPGGGMGITEPDTQVLAYTGNGRLHIDSPLSETVQVYSTGGVQLYNFKKSAGKVSLPINSVQDAILIIKGSSGWVRKIN
jgi:hypothetical protein